METKDKVVVVDFSCCCCSTGVFTLKGEFGEVSKADGVRKLIDFDDGVNNNFGVVCEEADCDDCCCVPQDIKEAEADSGVVCCLANGERSGVCEALLVRALLPVNDSATATVLNGDGLGDPPSLRTDPVLLMGVACSRCSCGDCNCVVLLVDGEKERLMRRASAVKKSANKLTQ